MTAPGSQARGVFAVAERVKDTGETFEAAARVEDWAAFVDAHMRHLEACIEHAPALAQAVLDLRDAAKAYLSSPAFSPLAAFARDNLTDLLARLGGDAKGECCVRGALGYHSPACRDAKGDA